jgi:transposase InsO family protein
VLAAHRGTADAAGLDWKSAVYRKIEEEVKAAALKPQGSLSIERMLELGRVSRSSYYRFDPQATPGPDPDMDVRDAIQCIAVEWPSYGRRRITAALRREGWTMNPKRVNRIMREDNLLCVRRRKFVVTTDSKHAQKIYPNLTRGIVLTGIDQLWRADITYIRLREEFVFLAVILDAYSRRVIGWALDRTLEDSLTLGALRMALACRHIQPGLIHHSDRGSQYASTDYTDLLKANGIQISMSRKGNPWDNAACESFMKTLKYEQVYRSEYRDLAEAHASIAEFLDQVYNQHRLHSALGYVPPAEFEAGLTLQKYKEAASGIIS